MPWKINLLSHLRQFAGAYIKSLADQENSGEPGKYSLFQALTFVVVISSSCSYEMDAALFAACSLLSCNEKKH